MWDLVFWPGMEPGPPASGAWGPSHWTTREVPIIFLLEILFVPFSRLAQLVKNPPAVRETWVRSLGWEDLLENGKATHSSILAWRIPQTVRSMASQRVRHDWATFTHSQAPGVWPPVVGAHELSSTGSMVEVHRLRCPLACGSSWSRDRTHIPLIGRWSFTTEPPGELQKVGFKIGFKTGFIMIWVWQGPPIRRWLPLEVLEGCHWKDGLSLTGLKRR